MKTSRQRFSFLSRFGLSTAHLKPSRPESRRLRFEPLEDRRMLAALTVNSAADNLISGDGLVTLREAILAANNDHFTDLGQSGFGADTILFSRFVFDVPIPKKITLTIPIPFEITEALTIDATALANNVIIDANNATRIFSITATTSNVTLAGLTLTGGNIAAKGGAVHSLMAGTLTIDQSTVSGNRTSGDSSRGGAIYSRGDVILTNSTVSGNSTTGNNADGGGIYSPRTVTLTNSTVSGNSTTGDNAQGGGIYSYGGATLTSSTVSGNSTAGLFADGGGIRSIGDVTLMNSTVTDNHVARANATGGGIWNSNDTLTITNSIVAGNTAAGGSPDFRSGQGALNIDFSLIEQTGLTFTGGNNIVGFPANLGPLANNGGPTKTHALLASSPGIDRGNPSIVFNPTEFDQRGAPFVRVLGGRVDIGAFELQQGSLLGDYNLNGTVDAADYTVWIDTLGSSVAAFTGADGDGDGVVDQDDHGVWVANFGNTAVVVSSLGGTSIPELVAEATSPASTDAETRKVGAAPTFVENAVEQSTASTLRFDITAARSSDRVGDDLLLLALDRVGRAQRSDSLTETNIAHDDSTDIRGLDSDPLAIALAEWL